MPGTDDLAPLLAGKRMAREGHGQGVLKSWDPDTFENVVDYNGTELRNLPVRSAVEALTFKPGQTVNLKIWSPSGGSAVVQIDGQTIVPGAGAAEQAIAWMTTTLAEALAAQIFADRISFGSVPSFQSTTSQTYTDLSTVGPTIDDIQVSDAGVMIVMVSAQADATIDTSTGQLNEFTYMSYDIDDADGVTVRAANDADALVGGFSADPSSGSIAAGVFANATKVVPETGLSAGEYSITAKYKVLETLGGSPSATFGDRTLTVIAF